MNVEAHFDDLDMRILHLMRLGYVDAAIGQRLGLGHRTVQRRICKMMERSNVRSRFAFGLRVSELNILERNETTC